MLEISAEPPTFQKPSKGPLHDPAAREYLKRPVFSFFDDLDGPSSRLFSPLGERLPAVSAVDPQVGEPRKIGLALLKEPLSSLAVSDVSGRDDNLDGKALRVDHQVPLSADQSLGSVESTLSTG